MEYLPLIIDLIVIAFFLFSLIRGRLKGFTAIILSMIITIICICFARTFSPVAAEFINRNFIHEHLTNSITNELSEAANEGKNKIAEALPNYLSEAINYAGFDTDSVISEDAIKSTGEKISNTAENKLVIPLLTSIAYVIMFVLSRSLGRLFAGFSKIFTKLPVIHSVDKTLGAIVGALKGFIMICIFLALLSAISGFMPDSQLNTALWQSSTFQIFNQHILTLM